jgi:hypothetical protein
MGKCFSIVGIGLFLLLAGCSGEPAQAIIGSWEGMSIKQGFDFGPDARVVLNDYRHGVYTGSYRVDAEGVLRCEFEQFRYPVVRTVEIDGDEMRLIDRNGIAEVYRRK